jgi:hypothetical protein|nr:MAG TPA: Protein of unknown function (DUF1804) [Caudoviricetes sp.]
MKTTPWNKIKAEYLQGVTPKELAQKYHLKAKQISDKANEEKWVAEKAKISENLRIDVQERIKDLTNQALEALCNVINDPECKNADKVSAARAILDVSGLKSLKQDITGIDGVSVVINREAVQVESRN